MKVAETRVVRVHYTLIYLHMYTQRQRPSRSVTLHITPMQLQNYANCGRPFCYSDGKFEAEISFRFSRLFCQTQMFRFASVNRSLTQNRTQELKKQLHTYIQIEYCRNYKFYQPLYINKLRTLLLKLCAQYCNYVRVQHDIIINNTKIIIIVSQCCVQCSSQIV